MGRSKLLLPWGASSVLAHLIQTWTELGATQIAVVCLPDGSDLLSELDRFGNPGVGRILNPEPDRGMFSSIQCAAAWDHWNSSLTHWIIALGDQPHLQLGTLRALLDAARAKPDNIWQPLRTGHRKHPLWLPKKEFLALRESPAADLKEFLGARAGEFAGFESDDVGLDFDMDTPADYERARRLYFKGEVD